MKTILQKDLWSITSFLENKEYNFNKENILTQLPEKFINEAIEAISGWDNYVPTPLFKLNKLNDELKLNNIYYKDEDKIIINPGSVGQPRDLDKRSSYAILDDEKCIVDFFRIEYDIESVREKIYAIPDLSNWLGDRLLEGR